MGRLQCDILSRSICLIGISTSGDGKYYDMQIWMHGLSAIKMFVNRQIGGDGNGLLYITTLL